MLVKQAAGLGHRYSWNVARERKVPSSVLVIGLRGASTASSTRPNSVCTSLEIIEALCRLSLVPYRSVTNRT